MENNIKALTQNSADRTAITGTQFGEKRALDVTVIAGANPALTLQKVSFSITLAQVNTWVQVPIVNFNVVADIQVFDAADLTQLFVDYRISSGNVVEIRSNTANTYTIHVLGY